MALICTMGCIEVAPPLSQAPSQTAEHQQAEDWPSSLQVDFDADVSSNLFHVQGNIMPQGNGSLPYLLLNATLSQGGITMRSTKYLLMNVEPGEDHSFEISKNNTLFLIDQHPVTEKFLAYGGAVRINNTEKTRTFGLPVHKYTSLLRGILTVGLQFFKFFCKLIAIFGEHMNMEEFVGDSIPAKIIMCRNFSFNFYEFPKTYAASPAPVALKLHHSKIYFMFMLIIKIGVYRSGNFQ